MSRFNLSVDNRIENLAGGKAYKESPEMQLISLVLTSFVNEQFYRSSNETIQNLEELFNQVKDKKFIAKLGIFARIKYGMRSITHILSALIAKNIKGELWTKNYFSKVVHRVDDITEILSYYIQNYKKPIPNSLKRGLAKAFEKFDQYQLAKYRSEKKGLKLIDVVNLIHPRPNEKNKEALKLLVENKLTSSETWESELTKAGQKATNDEEKEEFKKDVWIKLISEKKIGYFALLRNLRNIFEQAPEIMDKALEMLIDENLIKKSLVLPFRFTTAYQELQQTNSKVLKYVNKACDISLSNIPKFDGNTLVVLDVSGSMQGKPAEIGSLFSVALVKSNDADLIIFSDNAQYQVLNTDDSLITIANSIRFASGGTNFHSIFQEARKAYDRIIILSDMQGWIGHGTPVRDFNIYKQKFNCNPFIYSFDLQGYGSLQFPENNVFLLTGFSEKIFDLMKILETDKNALINEIDKIDI